jgi:MoxR-like ATPase
MNYSKIFNPPPPSTSNVTPVPAVADRQAESVYIYTDEIILAVNVALATGRPLLVRGPSGSGKSTLARNVAQSLNRRYYEHVVSSRTEARDLLWQVDLLRRLQDAQSKILAADFSRYVQPSVLWWAFDRSSALQQLALAGQPASAEPGENSSSEQSVVLLDEIDKADPDVPNNLLVPLGSLAFHVSETGQQVAAAQAPLVFLTTNDERDLPPAFVRRCVELKISNPSQTQLIQIGQAHFPAAAGVLLQKVAALFAPTSGEPIAGSPPSTAEYLDTIRACLTLNVSPGSPEFETLSRVTVWKHGRSAVTLATK